MTVLPKIHIKKIYYIVKTMSDKNIETQQKTFQNNVEMSQKTFHKMIFIMNAIEQGWSVKKINQSYIFTKKHENKKEVFQEDYLEKFVESNRNLPI